MCVGRDALRNTGITRCVSLWTVHAAVFQAERSGGVRDGGGVEPRLCHNFSTASQARSSSTMRAEVRRQACNTVVWSRPPKRRPIAGSDSPVSSRARYIATCRGQAIRGVRAVDSISCEEMLK